MKTTHILILITLALLVSFFILSQLNQTDNTEIEPKIIEQDESEKVENLAKNLPSSFEGVEMVTYKSADYNYEITYPKAWVAILAPREVIHEPNLEDYAIYPKEIPYGPSPIFNVNVYSETIKDFMEGMADVYDLTKIELNNLEGYRFSISKKETELYYLFKKDNDHIISILYWPDELYDVTEEEAMWVLSTLRLVE